MKLCSEKRSKIPRSFNLRDPTIFSQAFEAPERCCTTRIPFFEDLGFPKPQFSRNGVSVVDQPRSSSKNSAVSITPRVVKQLFCKFSNVFLQFKEAVSRICTAFLRNQSHWIKD